MLVIRLWWMSQVCILCELPYVQLAAELTLSPELDVHPLIQ